MKLKLNEAFYNEVTVYYKRFTLETLNMRLRRKLKKIAYKIADEVIDSYDFDQVIRKTLGAKGERIIITSVLTKKKEKK